MSFLKFDHLLESCEILPFLLRKKWESFKKRDYSVAKAFLTLHLVNPNVVWSKTNSAASHKMLYYGKYHSLLLADIENGCHFPTYQMMVSFSKRRIKTPFAICKTCNVKSFAFRNSNSFLSLALDSLSLSCWLSLPLHCHAPYCLLVFSFSLNGLDAGGLGVGVFDFVKNKTLSKTRLCQKQDFLFSLFLFYL